MLWENLREEEFKNAISKSCGVCVIPIGCLEKHGQHLPVGVDYFHAIHIAKEAAKLEEVMIFPLGSWCGDVTCFHAEDNPMEKRILGGIALKATTLLILLEELCDEIARNGFTKIIFLNAHGGNTPLLEQFMRSQCYKFRSYATMWTWAIQMESIEPKNLLKIINARKDDFTMITDEDISTLEKFAKTGCGGGHADFRETCVAMSYNEALVAKDKFDAESGQSTHLADNLKKARVKSLYPALVNYPNMYAANAPFGATKTIGDAMVKVCAERLAQTFKIIKADNEVLNFAKDTYSNDYKKK